MSVPGRSLALARTDADDRLIVADEPLAGWHRRCGGEMPGTLAIPALLDVVRKSRTLGLRLARTIESLDGDDLVRAWVEVAPDAGGEGGCAIALGAWSASPRPAEDERVAAARRVAIDRALAELTARLDHEQRVLTVDAAAPDLAELARAMRDDIGRRWSDFVTFPELSHSQALHWRLLDGARCAVPGSGRSWTANLVPLGQAEPGRAGFELLLVADTPLAVPSPAVAAAETPRPLATPSFGRELTPVLRQPIARIIANAETIRSRLAGPIAAEYSNYAADIAAAGQHLLALIEDLSDLEIVEADDFTTAPDRIDLADVARRAVGILGVRAGDRDIRLVAPGPDESLPAIGEFRRVLQILLNLVGNAIGYTPEGSTVTLALRLKDGRARITVTDEGSGIPTDKLDSVFDKFERLGRSGDGGSGLGLYISRRLARAMGGDLKVKNVAGTGARFMLDLPAAS